MSTGPIKRENPSLKAPSTEGNLEEHRVRAQKQSKLTSQPPHVNLFSSKKSIEFTATKAMPAEVKSVSEKVKRFRPRGG